MRFDFWKTHTRQKCTALLFLVIIFTLFAGLFFHIPAIGEQFLTTYRTNVLPGTPPLVRINGAIDAMETSIDAGIPRRTNFVELYGLAQLAMNKKIVIDPNYGALYKTPYGQITYAVGEKYLTKYLNNTFVLANETLTAGMQFLYVQAPFKLPDAHSQLPETVTDHTNQNADAFLAGLSAAGVDFMDLRPLLRESGMDQSQLFFDTDHHWTIDAAFYSTGKIVEKLNADYGFSIDPKVTQMENFDRKVYEDFYIGSMGRRVGRIYGGVDDFMLITPRFDTSYTLTEDGSTKFEGDFYGAVLNKSYIDKTAPLETNRYAVYHGDNAELVFENHLIKDGKILIIKDSFGLPVYSFLSLGVHEVRALDMRLFKEDVVEYVKKYRPDIVIMMYNGDGFSEQMFQFKAKTS